MQVITVVTLTSIVVGAFGVLQFGHWFSGPGDFFVGPLQTTDIDHAVRTPHEWLPLNPILWPKAHLRWTGLHTRLAIIVFAAILYWYHRMLQWRIAAIAVENHPDAIAKHMGKGVSMTLAAVTAKNKEAGYTVSDIVGLVICKSVQTSELLYAGWRSTMTAIMGPGSGKTTTLAVPFALLAPGWVYGTSNTRDFSDAIWEPRSWVGDMKVFDPQQIAEVPPDWYWDPISYVTGKTADTKAKILATLLYEAAKDPDSRVDQFFSEGGLDLVANLFLACSVAGLPITQAIEWVNTPQRDDPVAILRVKDSHGRKLWPLAEHNLQNAYDLNEVTKRGVFANARGILTFLFNQESLPWITRTGADDHRPQFVPADFVRSTGDTLISLSKEGIGSLSPVVAALTAAITEAAEDFAKTCKGGRLAVPGSVLLDEAANVARVKNLPDLYSHYGKRGIFILTILQSEAQGRAAWGKDGMAKMLGASTHRIYGRGIDDEDTLKRLSLIIGPHDVKQYSGGSSNPSGVLGKGNSSRNVGWSWHSKPIMEPADIHALPEWRAIISAAGERPVYVELVPYWERSPEMKDAVAESIALHGPRENVTV